MSFSDRPVSLPNKAGPKLEPPVLIALEPNPFESIKYSGVTYINVDEQNHGRSTGNIVRFRGPTNDTGYTSVQSFDNVTDISNANGFSIIVGKIDFYVVIIFI